MQPAAIKPLINLSQLEAVDIRVGTMDGNRGRSGSRPPAFIHCNPVVGESWLGCGRLQSGRGAVTVVEHRVSEPFVHAKLRL